MGKRTKVGEVVGRKVNSAFGLLRDVAALLHFVHQGAGETHTRGSHSTGCGASGKAPGLGWGAGWSGRCRGDGKEKLSLRLLILRKKKSLDGH